MRNAMRLRDSETLRAYIRLLRISERGLAERAGVGHATVNHLLSGRRTTCAPRTAVAIERALGCPPGLFFVPARGPDAPAGSHPRQHALRTRDRRDAPRDRPALTGAARAGDRALPDQRTSVAPDR